jgi:hypothetical protein
MNGTIISIGVGSIFNTRYVAGYPSILDDGNTVAWYDYQENITKDGANLVSVWGDKSGNSNDLLQAVGTNQSLWTSNGVLFDGIDNFMKTAPFTLNQPESIYIVFKQKTWTASDRVFDANTASDGFLDQIGTTPNIRTFAGITSAENSNLPLDTYGIVRVLFNGVSSKLQVNETTAITGDFGANNLGGFTLGARATGASQFSDIEVKEIIIRKVADTTQNETTIYNYLANKYSI